MPKERFHNPGTVLARHYEDDEIIVHHLNVVWSNNEPIKISPGTEAAAVVGEVYLRDAELGRLVKTLRKIQRQRAGVSPPELRTTWPVGTRLVGDQGYGPTTIRITYVSDQVILAVNERDGRESRWTLDSRVWREAA